MSNLLRSVPLLALLALVACDEKKTEPPTAPSAEAKPTAAPAASSAAATTASASASAAAAAPTDPPADPAAFDIDASHSRVSFSVRHMMVSNTRGQFGKFTGQVFLDEKDPKASNVSVEIDTASIDTADAKRDEHLKSPDFFDVKKFPKMSFKSTSVERSGAGWKVVGDLTIKDVKKPVTLTVDPIVKETKDPWGMVRRGTHAQTKIDRKEFGLSWNKALETGGVAVGDEITIDLDVELVKKVEKDAGAAAPKK